MLTLANRIGLVLKLRGISQAELARRSGVTRATVNDWINERSASISGNNLINVAKAVDVYPQWLANRSGAISAEHEAIGLRITKAYEEKGWSQGDLVRHINATQGGEVLSIAKLNKIEHGVEVEIVPPLSVYAEVLETSEQWLSGKEDNSEIELSNLVLKRTQDNIVIPHLSATGSMGKGIPGDLEHDTVVSQVSLTKPWIRENLSSISSPSNLAMITGYGDSMEGTFNHGDVLFVDTGIDDIKMDAVYVLNLNDGLYIKRLQRKPDGSILMISDNAKYQPYTIQNGEKDKFQVLGRIVGIWHFKRM